jgi:hypothetical protein
VLINNRNFLQKNCNFQKVSFKIDKADSKTPQLSCLTLAKGAAADSFEIFSESEQKIEKEISPKSEENKQRAE